MIIEIQSGESLTLVSLNKRFSRCQGKTLFGVYSIKVLFYYTISLFSKRYKQGIPSILKVPI